MGMYRYRIVDVFARVPLQGNPLAVVLEADDLSSEDLQRIAREFNLSETTFIMRSHRPDCATRFRIFTPTMEMRFAGHPTIGGAFVALAIGAVPNGVERFFIDEPIGPVAVRVEPANPSRLWLTTPPVELGATFNRRLCAEVLGLNEHELAPMSPQRLSAGNPTIYSPLLNPESVDRAWLDLAGVRRLHGGAASVDCVFVFAPTPGGAYSRMFAPEHGVVEDPATGSATGPLATYMMRHGLAPHSDGSHFVSEQGTRMGRRSLLHVAIHGEYGADGIEVGGDVVSFAEGTLHLAGTASA